MKSDIKIICKPLTPDLWSDLEKLFGKTGAYWGCWCMYWRCSNKQFKAMKGSDRKNALQKIVHESNHASGVLAYIDNKPIGWIALSPRIEYTRLVRSRVIKPIDDQPVWSIVCFFIHKNFRGKGVTTALLKEAEAYIKIKGGSILEAYPIETTNMVNDVSSYVGIDKWFYKAGYKKMADTKAKGDGKKRVIMRKLL